MPANEIMLDLETLGTGNDAAIMSIGAVRFNDDEGILDRFHVGIEPASCTDLGLKIEGDTVKWWLDPERDAARIAWLALEKVDLASALMGFAHWVGGSDSPIWGNGATFDNVLLRTAYAKAGLEYPAPFYLDKCYRTVKGMAPFIIIERVGTHHDAADDAESQARHLLKIRAHFREVTEAKAMLNEAAQQFRFYEQGHRAKDTPDAAVKADVNRQLAEKIEAALL